MRKPENICGAKPSGHRTSGTAAKKAVMCLRLAAASHRRRRSCAGEAPAGGSIDGFSRLRTITAKDADRLRTLSLLLTPDAKFSIGALSKALRSGTTRLFVLRRRGMIVACAAAVFFDTPTARHCRIEDVVVDPALRGAGLGRQIMEGTLSALRQDGVRNVELTSRPSRKAANALYRSLGFALRKTNVYALDMQMECLAPPGCRRARGSQTT